MGDYEVSNDIKISIYGQKRRKFQKAKMIINTRIFLSVSGGTCCQR